MFFKAAAIAQVLALTANFAMGTNRLVFTPKENTGAVLNVHKGWVQQIDSVYALRSSSADISTIVYTSYDWDDIEKSKGVYDWTAIDNMLAECRAMNRTFAFGIVPADSDDPDKGGLVPDYVYDEGCESVTAQDGSELRTPVWDDEAYLSASKELIKAIAKRYDGNPVIEYIDISTFGNKGDWRADGLNGSVMPSDETQKDMLKFWANSFSDTQLAVSGNAASAYAESLGIAYETSAVGKTAETVRSDIEKGGYSFVTADNSTIQKLGTEFMQEMQNKIGYSFVVKYANLRYEKGDAILSVKIKNTGTASQLFSFNLGAAFTDEKGEIFTQTGAKQLIRGGTFGAGEEKTYEIKFPHSDIPNKNNVFIAVGAFELSDSTTPSVKFANKPDNDKNYLILGAIR